MAYTSLVVGTPTATVAAAPPAGYAVTLMLQHRYNLEKAAR
jgi:hypothetical protein